MELFDKQALLSAISLSQKPLAYLVGSPLSTDSRGRGVPGVASILELIQEFVQTEAPFELTRFQTAVAGKAGPVAYQSAMTWLQANIHQDAVNKLVRRAVLQACTHSDAVGNPDEPTKDGSPEHWLIPGGTRALASVVCNSTARLAGPILTPNFDPLISLAIRALGARPSIRVLDADGSLPRDFEEDVEARTIIHFHGYWRGSDTLHTPSQLSSPRPKLKASLQRILKNHLLVVVAYGGWDDVFTSALTSLLHDEEASLDILWCFYEDNAAAVEGQYKTLFQKVAPAIARGRFRCYGGIDCHSVFTDIATIFSCSPSSAMARSFFPPKSDVLQGQIARYEQSHMGRGSIPEEFSSQWLDLHQNHLQRVTLTKIEAKEAIQLEFPNNPYGDDGESSTGEVHFFVSLPQFGYIMNPIKPDHTPACILCTLNPAQLQLQLEGLLSPQLILTLRTQLPDRCRDNTKLAIYEAIGTAVKSSAFVVGATFCKRLINLGIEQPVLTYRTIIDLFIARVLEKHKEWGVTRANTLIGEVGGGGKIVLGNMKTVLKASFPGRAYGGVDFVSAQQEFWLLACASQYISWALRQLANKGEARWMKLLQRY